MNPHYEKKLEEVIHRELARLPERPAPDGLIPGVLAAIQAQAARPWWRKPFPLWPRHLQITFLAIAFALLTAVAMGATRYWPQSLPSDLAARVTAAAEPLRPFWGFGEALAGAALSVLKWIGQPILIGIAVGLGFLYFSCVGLGVAWYRITSMRPSPTHS